MEKNKLRFRASSSLWLLIATASTQFSFAEDAIAKTRTRTLGDIQSDFDKQCRELVSKKSIVVPVIHSNPKRMMFIKVLISDVPYLFLVDTGASHILIHSNIRPELLQHDSIRLSADENVVVIDQLKIGESTLFNAPAATIDFKDV